MGTDNYCKYSPVFKSGRDADIPGLDGDFETVMVTGDRLSLLGMDARFFCFADGFSLLLCVDSELFSDKGNMLGIGGGGGNW
jgi:hypothetical protein